MSTTLVMGVLNVTPDSFYDGGRYHHHEAAIVRGLDMVAQGADIIDVGGESSRPYAEPVSEDEELSRTIPVIEGLRGAARISIDTMKPAVAKHAIAAGATLLNDVSASFTELAAASNVGLLIMHMQGRPQTMQDNPHYDDVVGEVHESLRHAAAAARSARVSEVYVDPGIGFGKTAAHNLRLLRSLPELVAAGTPVAVGVSRKGFVGSLGRIGNDQLAASDRLEGSLALGTWAVACGVSIIRVHDVIETARAVRLVTEDPRVLEGVGSA